MKSSKVNMRHFVKVELGTYYAEVETEMYLGRKCVSVADRK